METFITRLEQLLKEKHISQSKLAVDVNMRRSTLSDWKNNGSVPPVDLAIKIADYLETSVEYLVTGKEIGGITHNQKTLLDNWNKLPENIREFLDISIQNYLKEKEE
jgi:transcriptional regulator with XRE-family HTH domain